MDLKVFTKEEVIQPQGTEYVYVPNVIDIYPLFDDSGNVLVGSEILEDKDELTQQCSLSTIWQRGLDPLSVNEGIRWSEVILGEINVVQLINDITDAVRKVSTSVKVKFDTTTDANGNSFLTYKIGLAG